MAIHAPAHTVAVLTASFAFLAAVNTAALASDGVSLSESTISWSTVNYATSAENGFVDGSLDKRTIVDSVKKTGRLVVASDDMKTGGVGAEIGATVYEEAIDYIKAPLVRVCSPDVPVPFAPPLEREYMPNAQKLEQAIEKLFA